MRKLCACLLLSGLMVVGCNKPSSHTSGRINSGASGNSGRTSNYGPGAADHGATGNRPGGINNPNSATPPGVNAPPPPGAGTNPSTRPGTPPGAEHPGPTTPGGLNEGRPGPAPGGLGAGGAAMDPEHFATQAWQGDEAEIKLAQLAEKNGSNSAVKKFAQTMIQDHGQANEQLQGIAKSNSWTMPKSINQHDQQEYDRLAKLKGQEFDRAYIQTMLQDHQHDIQLFQQEARNGKNKELQSWAQKTLPTLQKHLQLAQDAAKELGINTSTNR